MANFKNLEMAPVVSSRDDILVKKGFLGLTNKVFYAPTQSPVDVMQIYYSAENSERIKRVLKAADVDLEQVVRSAGTVEKSGTGPFRLDVCLSQDGRFAAVQAFGYADLLYHPMTDIRIFNDAGAQAMKTLLKG